MNAPEFRKWPEIKRLESIDVIITQKIHGSNAQVMIVPREDGHYDVLAGSRTRWLTIDHDNYGFAAWVQSAGEDLIRALGPGRHYGEWAGPGINNGEGLTEKTFVLFDVDRYADKTLSGQLRTVPVLYRSMVGLGSEVIYAGLSITECIDQVLEDLRVYGSRLVSGFMHPEGIVVQVGAQRWKHVFAAEETKWIGVKEPKPEKVRGPDCSHLLQSLRLTKLLSCDEVYRRDYPQTLSAIVRDYIADLIKEGQVANVREVNTRQVFAFVRETIG